MFAHSKKLSGYIFLTGLIKRRQKCQIYREMKMICFKEFFHKGKSTLKKYMQSRNFCLFDLFYMWLGLLFFGRKLAEDHKLIVRVSSSQMRVL